MIYSSRNFGNSLTQYAIIIVLVGLALVPLFLLMGKNIVSIVTKYTYVFDSNNTKIEQTMNLYNTGMPGVGSPNNPIKTCNDGSCTIDYGTFILQGIPDNFNELVETTGASGGSEALANLMKQIAEQLKMTNPGASDDIMVLANMGHNLAAVQKQLEQIVVNCNRDRVCVQDTMKQPFVPPPGFNTSIMNYIEGENFHKQMNYLFDLDQAINYKLDDPATYEANLAYGGMGYEFLEQFDKIMNNNSLDNPTKGVLRELYWEIGVVAVEFDDLISIINTDNAIAHSDPLTGEPMPDFNRDDPFAPIETYTASTVTNIESALMCAAGWHEDIGTECH